MANRNKRHRREAITVLGRKPRRGKAHRRQLCELNAAIDRAVREALKGKG